MKQEHFLSKLLKLNSKRRLREITIGPPRVKHKWESGGTRSEPTKQVRCAHCTIPMVTPNNSLVVRAICHNCITRQRLAASI
jgi:hypothetical protein